jgi:hypothetical protein
VPDAGGCIINALRQQPAEVDAVGRGQTQLGREVTVQEGFFDHALAVIERARDGIAVDVVTPAGQLPLLGGRDEPLREQHTHLESGASVERRSDRTTRIARGRHQNVQGSLVRPSQTRERCRKKTGAEVLEGRGRTMEQFEDLQMFCRVNALDRHQGDGKIECLGQDLRYLRRERTILCERLDETRSDRCQRIATIEIRWGVSRP